MAFFKKENSQFSIQIIAAKKIDGKCFNDVNYIFKAKINLIICHYNDTY